MRLAWAAVALALLGPCHERALAPAGGYFGPDDPTVLDEGFWAPGPDSTSWGAWVNVRRVQETGLLEWDAVVQMKLCPGAGPGGGYCSNPVPFYAVYSGTVAPDGSGMPGALRAETLPDSLGALSSSWSCSFNPTDSIPSYENADSSIVEPAMRGFVTAQTPSAAVFGGVAFRLVRIGPYRHSMAIQREAYVYRPASSP